MNGDDGKQMINELKQYIDDGMLISFLQIKSIDHPKVLKFVSFKNNILRLLMINEYCGVEDFGHVLNVHYQRYLNEEILLILNNIFTFVKEVLVIATFDDDCDYLVQQQGFTVNYPYATEASSEKFSFHDLNKFFLDQHPNIESYYKFLTLKDKNKLHSVTEVMTKMEFLNNYSLGWFIEDATTICFPNSLRLKGTNHILANIDNLPKQLKVSKSSGFYVIIVNDISFFDDHIYKRIIRTRK